MVMMEMLSLMMVTVRKGGQDGDYDGSDGFNDGDDEDDRVVMMKI